MILLFGCGERECVCVCVGNVRWLYVFYRIPIQKNFGCNHMTCVKVIKCEILIKLPPCASVMLVPWIEAGPAELMCTLQAVDRQGNEDHMHMEEA